MDIDELTYQGFTSEIIAKWKQVGYEALLPVQQEAIEKGVLAGNSLLVVAPTSSGKTFVGEMAAINFSLRGRKTLYLVPFKALAEEFYLDFTEKYGEPDIGFIIRISDRDHRETDDQIRIGNYDIAILTYEKLSSLLVTNPGILDGCDCVVVDEVQMFMDPERGGNLELLLTKIKSTTNKAQIIALSAVLGNLNDFDKWLDAEVIHHKKRPIELRQGIVVPDGTFEYREWNSGNVGNERFRDGSLNGLVAHLFEEGEQVIIIRNTVRESQKTAVNLAGSFGHLPAAPQAIEALNAEPETETRDILLKTFRHSIAFHHADCELGERRIVEEGFRNGQIRLVSATTTLSMGVNLPCKTVILADNFRWEAVRGGFQKTTWSVGEVRNIFGRAGRLGKGEEFGRGILLASNSREYRQAKGAYLDAPLEPLYSSFERKDIALRVLDVVATGFGGDESDIENFIFQTFAAQTWKTPQAQEQIRRYIGNGVGRCLESGLFETTPTGTIRATNLGRICAGKGCSIETFLLLKEYIEGLSSVNTLDLVFVAALAEEVRSAFYRGVKWYAYERRERVANRLNVLSENGELSGWIGNAIEELGSTLGEDKAPQFTIALLANDILQTSRTNRELREGYDFTSANIRNMCLNLSWMLDIMSAIADAINPNFAYDLTNIADCVQNRVPTSCRLLNRIHVVLSRDEKIRLIEQGYVCEDDFLDKKGSDFKGIIDPKKADRIIEQINQRRVKNHDFWVRDHRRRLDSIGLQTKDVDAVYETTGLDLERSVCELFDTGFTTCRVTRITDQKKGEPDLLMTFADGKKFAVQVTAKEKTTSFINSKKAGEVVPQSARLQPDGYICLGRPDFQDFAKEQAIHLAKKDNFKLLPMYVLVELYVQVRESKIDGERAARYLFTSTGYLSVAQIEGFKPAS
jgi:helicase